MKSQAQETEATCSTREKDDKFVNSKLLALKSLHINTLRTGDADLRFYITTVLDG